MKNETKTQKKFVGNAGWLLFWGIFCWPVAFFYYFNKKE